MKARESTLSREVLDPTLIACGLTTLDELKRDDWQAAYELDRQRQLETKRDRHRASRRKR